MDKQLIAGTYTYVKGNEGLDFWAKLGILNIIILSEHKKSDVIISFSIQLSTY